MAKGQGDAPPGPTRTQLALAIALLEFAAFELASAPLAWLAAREWQHWLSSHSSEADAAFHGLAGTFYAGGGRAARTSSCGS